MSAGEGRCGMSAAAAELARAAGGQVDAAGGPAAVPPDDASCSSDAACLPDQQPAAYLGLLAAVAANVPTRTENPDASEQCHICSSR